MVEDYTPPWVEKNPPRFTGTEKERLTCALSSAALPFGHGFLDQLAHFRLADLADAIEAGAIHKHQQAVVGLFLQADVTPGKGGKGQLFLQNFVNLYRHAF